MMLIYYDLKWGVIQGCFILPLVFYAATHDHGTLTYLTIDIQKIIFTKQII